jgi:lipopolysaccharide/colanic/teichoic acid biosynthesis glycosyltransferase
MRSRPRSKRNSRDSTVPADPVAMHASAAGSSVRDQLRRLADILLASLALVLLAPVMSLVAVALLLESGRPVFFAQARLGQHGRPFRMLKFRKFPADCSGGSPLTLAQDRRLTRVGKVLATTKLDELPQLFNVLKGDMALVGPRPESLAFGHCFEGAYRRVLEHKPGIVGPSQVMFRNENTLFLGKADPVDFYCRVVFPAKARLDLAYYPRRSLARDFLWLLRGAMAVAGTGPRGRRDAMVLEESASIAGPQVERLRRRRRG